MRPGRHSPSAACWPPPPTLKPGDIGKLYHHLHSDAVGPQTGALQVGSDTFVLSATGPGQQLTFSYVRAGQPFRSEPAAQWSFPPFAVSQSEKVMFTVMNSGTSTAIISLISTSRPFSLSPLPVFRSLSRPANPPRFGLHLLPTATGPVSGTLLINNTSVPLSGAGNTPPALPSYTLTGPSGNVSPASQENVSLTLAKSVSSGSQWCADSHHLGQFWNGPRRSVFHGEYHGEPNCRFRDPGRQHQRELRRARIPDSAANRYRRRNRHAYAQFCDHRRGGRDAGLAHHAAIYGSLLGACVGESPGHRLQPQPALPFWSLATQPPGAWVRSA